MAQDEQVTLLYLVKQLELAVRSRLDRVVAEAGLTTIQYTALTVLERHPDMTSAVLARLSFVRAQTMAELVAALDRRGLIERHPDPNSRRQNLIRLTDAGRAVLEQLREPVARIEREMTESTTPEHIETARAALHAWRDALADDVR